MEAQNERLVAKEGNFEAKEGNLGAKEGNLEEKEGHLEAICECLAAFLHEALISKTYIFLLKRSNGNKASVCA